MSHRFRVIAQLDSASNRPQEGTVTVDRVSGIVRVRPLRRRKVYEMPLAEVASWIVRSQLAAEAREKRQAKSKRGASR